MLFNLLDIFGRWWDSPGVGIEMLIGLGRAWGCAVDRHGAPIPMQLVEELGAVKDSLP